MLDTSLWIRILNDDPTAKAALEDHASADLVTHPLVLAELTTAALRGRSKRPDVVAEVEAACVYEDMTREDALEGAGTWVRLRKAGREKVSLADCIILATARRVGARLLTCDSDLRKESGVLVIG